MMTGEAFRPAHRWFFRNCHSLYNRHLHSTSRSSSSSNSIPSSWVIPASIPVEKNLKERRRGKKQPRFVDRIRLHARGGHGGQGSLSTQLVQGYKKVPDGGHGGQGGSVILIADEARGNTLQMSHKHVLGEKGANGTSNQMNGKAGQNTIVRVPVGVCVKRVLEPNERWDQATQSVIKIPYNESEQQFQQDEDNDEELERLVELLRQGKEIEVFPESATEETDAPTQEDSTKKEKVVIADLDKPGSHIVVARGGRGGFGTSLYSSRHGGLPSAKDIIRKARPQSGETVHLELELKMLADIGLVGFPNAGKSSLLRALSRAAPAVAPYPFTTLHPIIGTVEYRDGLKVRVADIPGLIDGASEGRGKGHDFLRHIERTKALLYVVDGVGVDFRNPVHDLEVLVRELEAYGDGSLLTREALLVANKCDLMNEDQYHEVLKTLDTSARNLGIRLVDDVLGISAGVSGFGLVDLTKIIRKVVLSKSGDVDDSLVGRG